MNNSKQQILFQKYLSGDANQEEIEELMRLIEREGMKDLESLSQKAWEEEQFLPLLSNVEGDDLKKKIMNSAGIISSSGRRAVSAWLKVAAVVVPLLIGGAVLYLWDQPLLQQEVAVAVPASEYVEKVNPKGQKSTITLGDGTVVNLNADSKLIYKKPFDKEQRRVTLEGEAFFDVAKDASRPFIIHTDEIATTVVGTSFNIRAFKGSREILVAVASGKVRVEKISQQEDGETEEPLFLAPNEMGRYSTLSSKIEKRSFDQMSLFGWKEGVIYFKDASFKEVRERLEQWYGVTFLIEKPIDSKKDFTGSYKNKALSTVLEGVSFVYDFEFEINDKLIIIK